MAGANVHELGEGSCHTADMNETDVVTILGALGALAGFLGAVKAKRDVEARERRVPVRVRSIKRR